MTTQTTEVQQNVSPSSPVIETATSTHTTSRAEHLASVAKEMTKTDAPAAAPVVETKPEVKQTEVAPAAAPEPVAKEVVPEKAEPFAAQFQKLAKEKATLQQEMKKIEDTRKAYASLESALKAGNAEAIVKALGYDKKVFAKALGVVPPAQETTETETATTPELHPEVAQIKNELAELRAERTQRMRSDVMARVETELKGLSDKYPLVNGLGGFEEVLGVLEQHHREHGSLPSDNFGENVQLAAKLVEQRLEGEKMRWSKVLTPAQAQTTVPAGASGVAPGPQGVGTLHNGMASGSTKPAAKTRADILKELAADPSFSL